MRSRALAIGRREQASRAVWYFTLPSGRVPTAIPFTSLIVFHPQPSIGPQPGPTSRTNQEWAGAVILLDDRQELPLAGDPHFIHSPAPESMHQPILSLSGFFSLQVLRGFTNLRRGLCFSPFDPSRSVYLPPPLFASRGREKNNVSDRLQNGPFALSLMMHRFRSLFPQSFFSVTTSSQPVSTCVYFIINELSKTLPSRPHYYQGSSMHHATLQ